MGSINEKLMYASFRTLSKMNIKDSFILTANMNDFKHLRKCAKYTLI